MFQLNDCTICRYFLKTLNLATIELSSNCGRVTLCALVRSNYQAPFELLKWTYILQTNFQSKLTLKALIK